MSTKRFSWLHLSDLHIGQKAQWLWPNFKSIFLKDLQRLATEAGPIDLVLFSGDMVQAGLESEFKALSQELSAIWETFDKLGQKPLLFSVPGNHDLERPPSNDARMKALINWSNDQDVVREFWEQENNQYIQVVQQAFSNYSKWQEEVVSQGIPLAQFRKGLLPGDASSSLLLNGISVGLIGLNSSFLQLNESNFTEKLTLDLRQLNAVTDGNPPAWCDKHDANFLITHHPPSWLSSAALREFHTEIYPPGRFTAHFFGHMHDADLSTKYAGGDAGRKSFQSSSLFGMEFIAGGATERVHGYSIGQIAFNDEGVSWKLWPRKGKVNPRSGERRLIPDHDNFELTPGCEYQQEELEKRTPTSKSVVVVSKRSVDLLAPVEEKVVHWNNALHSSLYPLSEQNHHLAIRPLQQQSFIESIRKHKLVWVTSDWGLGRDGFLWSVVKRLSRDKQPTYLITLNNYKSREDFLSSFTTLAGCSFPEFCSALVSAGSGTLLLDDAPVSSGDSIGPSIERDVELLAEMVRDFCPDIILILIARAAPRDHNITVVTLEPLDEADTRTYLMAHPGATVEMKSLRAVSEIYRRTDGLPGKIDSIVKTLRVANFSELGLAASITRRLPIFE